MEPAYVVQLVLNGLVNGCGYAVLGLCMSLILSVTHRFHFAFALTYTLGGFVAAVLATKAGLPAPVALIVAIASTALLGGLIELIVYRPLARRSPGSALLSIFVSSLGLTIAGQSAIQLLWARTSAATSFPLTDIVTLQGPLGVRISNLDLIYGLTAIIIGIGAAIVLRYTSPGRVIRGVRDNPLMARAVGIDPARLYVLLFVVLSAVIGLFGALSAARFSATPDMGYDPLFSAFVVAFVSGSAAPLSRVILVGLGLGVLTSLSSIWVPTSLSAIVIFGVLFVYLSLQGYRTALRARTPRTRKA